MQNTPIETYQSRWFGGDQPATDGTEIGRFRVSKPLVCDECGPAHHRMGGKIQHGACNGVFRVAASLEAPPLVVGIEVELVAGRVRSVVGPQLDIPGIPAKLRELFRYIATG